MWGTHKSTPQLVFLTCRSNSWLESMWSQQGIFFSFLTLIWLKSRLCLPSSVLRLEEAFFTAVRKELLCFYRVSLTTLDPVPLSLREPVEWDCSCVPWAHNPCHWPLSSFVRRPLQPWTRLYVSVIRQREKSVVWSYMGVPMAASLLFSGHLLSLLRFFCRTLPLRALRGSEKGIQVRLDTCAYYESLRSSRV